jgi:hypothetical protein
MRLSGRERRGKERAMGRKKEGKRQPRETPFAKGVSLGLPSPKTFTLEVSDRNGWEQQTGDFNFSAAKTAPKRAK